MRRRHEYREDEELRHYIAVNRDFFTTPLEKRAERLGVLREKARLGIEEPSNLVRDLYERLLAQYETEVDEEIRAAIGSNLASFRRFQEAVTQRIDEAFASGALQPNRCPVCQRIVATPEARQCLWCGHDWHSA